MDTTGRRNVKIEKGEISDENMIIDVHYARM